MLALEPADIWKIPAKLARVGTFNLFQELEQQMKISLRWALALSMLSPSTMACAGSLPTGFAVGYNEAWIESSYSNWLASNNIPGLWNLPSNFNSSLVEAMFAGMAQGNAKIVRIWLFPNMQGVVIDPSKSPQTRGLYTPAGQQTPEIITNLTRVFQLARTYGLKLYITALDANSMKAVAGSTNTLHTYYQRLMSNSSEILAYDSQILAPILTWIVNNNYMDVVYAFDLINEIEAAINTGYFPNYWTGARAWISNMAYAITNTPQFQWLPVTSTAGWGSAVLEVTLGLFSELRLNFYDVHIYSDTGSYSGQTALCNKARSDKLPIILGEFGQSSSAVSDNIQNTATFTFLAKAKSSCFSSALAWKYEGAYYPLPTNLGEPQYSYLYVNVTSDPSSNGTLSTACNPQLPGPACPRPAYMTVKSFQ
jgi:hypothetical protein